MTIKQLGGVFGRNPTFNDVTIEGQLTFNGDIDIDSDLKVDGDLDVTGTSNLAAIAGTGNVVLGNTVTNPASNFANQQGFGWNDSTKVLELSSSVAALELGRTSGGGDGQLLLFRQATNVAAEIRVEGNAGYFKPYNGGGIDFSATAGPNFPAIGTSELLADYEEGTWTPTITGSSSNPTVTYGLQRGVYSKVGRLVTATAYLSWSAFSGGSGDCYISDLPFVIEGAVGAGAAAAISQLDGVTFTVNRDNFGLFGSPSTSTLKFTCYGSATTTDSIPTTSIAASGLMVLTISYQS
jgi:hypothetical protein